MVSKWTLPSLSFLLCHTFSIVNLESKSTCGLPPLLIASHGHLLVLFPLLKSTWTRCMDDFGYLSSKSNVVNPASTAVEDVQVDDDHVSERQVEIARPPDVSRTLHDHCPAQFCRHAPSSFLAARLHGGSSRNFLFKQLFHIFSAKEPGGFPGCQKLKAVCSKVDTFRTK